MGIYVDTGLVPYLSLSTKINFKLIKDLRKNETVKWKKRTQKNTFGVDKAFLIKITKSRNLCMVTDID